MNKTQNKHSNSGSSNPEQEEKMHALPKQDLSDFLSSLRTWTQKIRAGELSARIPVSEHSEITELSQDINFVGEMLGSLSQDAELQLQLHTEHIGQKNKSLETLYDVVTSINMTRDVQTLLTHFLHTMTELSNAHAASVYLSAEENTCSLIAEIGLTTDFNNRHPFLPEAIRNSEQQTIPVDIVTCPQELSEKYFNNKPLSILVVPLQYRGNILGVYNLYIDENQFSNKSEYEELFTSIGRHLGIAVEKSRLDEETNELNIVRERTSFANELHDSLAQTLASVKYQVRVLDETIHQEDEAATWQELERIETTIDEANSELRALIAHFRIPSGEYNFTGSVEQIVERFKHDSDGIQVYLQKEWPNIKLPEVIELQVLRIIQETLTNARKHSEANTVRVWMHGDEKGHYTVLIEDDGVGISERQKQNSAGEHVGLSVMKDRANRIGGTLSIEGDAGEGVQVRLEFDYSPDAPQNTSKPRI
ncbi:MAG: GAF domain-containing protein [Gammaproteobacteria bacterium]|nr:MAG: GAF domain-containing protein [Gammaproteobacteria bacterium]